FDSAARCSHHRGGGGARLRVDHLARHHGAGRHAEGDRRLAQCRDQQGDQPPRRERSVGQAGSGGAGDDARRVRRLPAQGHREVGAGGESVGHQGGVTPPRCGDRRRQRRARPAHRRDGHVFDIARALQTAENIARSQDNGGQTGEEETMLSAMKFKIILWGKAQLLTYAAGRAPALRARLQEPHTGAPAQARGAESGRWDADPARKVTSGSGLRADADVTLAFKTAALGCGLLMPPINWLDQINAQKDFKLTVEGPEDLTNWFAQTIMMSQSVGLKIGTRLADGTMRY